jgi:hypothetical protein
MNRKFLVLICLLFSVLGCEKNKVDTKTVPGLWTGTASSTTEGPKPYSWSVKPDGTMTWEGNWVGSTYQFGTGTWVLSGNTLTCNLITIYGYSGTVGTTQIFTAQFDPINGTLSSGTWRNTNINNITGTFQLTKIQ